MSKLIVQLNGGLGNQLFQYACARSLALRHGADLVLDDWSGFVRDFQYQRHYELSALPVRGRIAHPIERLPIWYYRWRHRTSSCSRLVERFLFGAFISETQLAWIPELSEILIDQNSWIMGYWQCPRYFKEHADQIRTELMPPPPVQERFRVLGEQIRSAESIAIGVRLYEESLNPTAHARDGKIKRASEINKAIARLRQLRPNARFFVFCTHRSPMLNQLALPNDAIFVTHDDGYEGTLERLWLLTQCRHHLFTNSSYYWWGAWLSASVRGAEDQSIIAADNFTNRDALCQHWESF